MAGAHAFLDPRRPRAGDEGGAHHRPSITLAGGWVGRGKQHIVASRDNRRRKRRLHDLTPARAVAVLARRVSAATVRTALTVVRRATAAQPRLQYRCPRSQCVHRKKTCAHARRPHTTNRSDSTRPSRRSPAEWTQVGRHAMRGAAVTRPSRCGQRARSDRSGPSLVAPASAMMSMVVSMVRGGADAGQSVTPRLSVCPRRASLRVPPRPCTGAARRPRSGQYSMIPRHARPR